jgi:phosphoribosylanthranilate isomerase
VLAAEKSAADYILLDNGSGTGQAFDWSLIRGIRRPYFLAGGLSPDNVKEAVSLLLPYAVDVSSGIETDGFKDPVKMKQFILNARS